MPAPLQLDLLTGEPIKPWDRQPGETTKAFAAFTHYRDQGVSRTVERTGEWWSKEIVRQGRTKRGATSRVQSWSRDNRWRDRAEAWDREVERVRQASVIKRIVDMSERHRSESEAGSRVVAFVMRQFMEVAVRDGVTSDKAQALLRDMARLMTTLPRLHEDERIALAGSAEAFAGIVAPRDNEEAEGVVLEVIGGAEIEAKPRTESDNP